MVHLVYAIVFSEDIIFKLKRSLLNKYLGVAYSLVITAKTAFPV